MQQIYARIKRTSKYYQSQHNRDQPLFPVFVASPLHEEYCVHGGPGGQYRKADVTLFTVDESGQAFPLW